jgi:hypothetical protein
MKRCILGFTSLFNILQPTNPLLQQVGKNLPLMVSKNVALRKQKLNRIQQRIDMSRRERELSDSEEESSILIDGESGKALARRRDERFDATGYNMDEQPYIDDLKGINGDSEDNDELHKDDLEDDDRELKKSKVDDMDELTYLKDHLQKFQQ